MRKFKNKNTGEIAEEYPDYYRTRYWNTINDIPKRLIENSCDWVEIIELPVGTKVRDTFYTGEIIYEKQSNGKWKIDTENYFTINIEQIGKGKKFEIMKNFLLEKYTEDSKSKKEQNFKSFLTNLLGLKQES